MLFSMYDFEFFGWFVLHDFSDDINRTVASEFGLENYEEYVVWQGSLGLIEFNGNKKKGWKIWMNKMSELQ